MPNMVPPNNRLERERALKGTNPTPSFSPVRHIVSNGKVLSPEGFQEYKSRQRENSSKRRKTWSLTQPTPPPQKNLPCGHRPSATEAEYKSFLESRLILCCRICRRYFAFFNNDLFQTAGPGRESDQPRNHSTESHVTAGKVWQGGRRPTVGEHGSVQSHSPARLGCEPDERTRKSL